VRKSVDQGSLSLICSKLLSLAAVFRWLQRCAGSKKKFVNSFVLRLFRVDNYSRLQALGHLTLGINYWDMTLKMPGFQIHDKFWRKVCSVNVNACHENRD
jgi:hypothetical protein